MKPQTRKRYTAIISEMSPENLSKELKMKNETLNRYKERIQECIGLNSIKFNAQALIETVDEIRVIEYVIESNG